MYLINRARFCQRTLKDLKGPELPDAGGSNEEGLRRFLLDEVAI
jgi:hypothetical protein